VKRILVLRYLSAIAHSERQARVTGRQFNVHEGIPNGTNSMSSIEAAGEHEDHGRLRGLASVSRRPDYRRVISSSCLLVLVGCCARYYPNAAGVAKHSHSASPPKVPKETPGKICNTSLRNESMIPGCMERYTNSVSESLVSRACLKIELWPPRGSPNVMGCPFTTTRL
jgi:hypothetical protein